MARRRLTFNPRIFEHLGKDLVTSPDVALTELVKNSIDAKAPNIRVELFMRAKNCGELFAVPVGENVPTVYLEKPLLVVSDDGCGMDSETIDAAFLTIGTDYKIKDESSFGSKGIGRLAAQRLGDFLVVETSAKDSLTTYTFINWNDVFSGESNVLSLDRAAKPSHTKLWIFNAKIDDYIENSIVAMNLDKFEAPEQVCLKSEIASALFFIVSPFHDLPKWHDDDLSHGVRNGKPDTKPNISFLFEGRDLDLYSPTKMIAVSESKHSFIFRQTEDESSLDYRLDIKPWYIERIHKSVVGSRRFGELKRAHSYYKELLKKNEERLNNALHLTLSYDDLLEHIKDSLRSPDSSLQEENKEIFEGILHGEATSAVERLLEIAPISGDLYSFRHDVSIGRNIILESAASLGEIHSDNGKENATLELKDVQRFLAAYNGIKLYRGTKRIGFLGNKESDWVRLQQYRTKGQQFYRFDLGNIVGFVSVSDAAQKNIEEISSRLDISQNDTSIIFKFLVEFVFNELFYELNRKANELIKVILDEEGVTSKPLSRQVSEDKDALRRLFEKNTELQTESDKLRWIIERADDRCGDEVFSQEHLLDKVTAIKGGLISEQKMHRIIKKSFDKIDEQLNQINIESYNNYKLMANGLVTESIVHQLDAIMCVSLPRDYKEHAECLKRYFRETNNFKFYTTHVSPIKDGLDVIESSFDKIAALHVLLEGSFVHKGGQDDFVNQDIGAAASEVWNGLLRGRSIRDIELSVKLDGLSWRVPKGTLNHVFYNLFDNSIYWIRRDAFNGESGCVDAIVTVQKGEDGEVLVFDSGPGVDRSMEDILFAPLESSKPRSERRGMGLYVVKMLLNSYGADIVLLEERNAKGNRYIFQINPAEAREN